MTVLGRGVVGRAIYADARADRDTALKAALAAIDASAELTANVARLTIAVEALTAAQRETMQVLRGLATAVELATKTGHP